MGAPMPLQTREDGRNVKKIFKSIDEIFGMNNDAIGKQNDD